MRITVDLSRMEENAWDRLGGELWLRRTLLTAAPKREDEVDVWISERCDLAESYRVRVADAYKDYQAWCSANGEGALSQNKFTRRLCNADVLPLIEKSRFDGDRVYLGLRLKINGPVDTGII